MIPLVSARHFKFGKTPEAGVERRGWVYGSVHQVCIQRLPDELRKRASLAATPLVQALALIDGQVYLCSPCASHIQRIIQRFSRASVSGERRFGKQGPLLRFHQRNPDHQEVDSEWDEARDAKHESLPRIV